MAYVKILATIANVTYENVTPKVHPWAEQLEKAVVAFAGPNRVIRQLKKHVSKVSGRPVPVRPLLSLYWNKIIHGDMLNPTRRMRKGK